MAKSKSCPIRIPFQYSNREHCLDAKCIGKDCAWWSGWAQDCSIPLIAGILADSTICRNEWEWMEDANNERS